MAYLSASIEAEHNLLLIKVRGELSTKEAINFAIKSYTKHPKPLVLWDLTEASLSKIKKDEIITLADQIKNVRTNSARGKAAFVTHATGDFGILRMYEAYAELKNDLIEYEIFYDIQAARAWLSIDSSLLLTNENILSSSAYS